MERKERNILYLGIIKVSKWFMLFMPIVVLFYGQNGLGMEEIMILQAVYSVSIIILEIPSGYFADVLGRRLTLIAGSVLGTAGFTIYSFSYGFYGFLAAEMVLGLGQSFISGADSAMLYDTLLDKKRDKEYTKYEGRITALGNFAEAIAGITGGFLAEISLRLPYFVQIFVAFFAIPASFLLIEPVRHVVKSKVSFRDIVNIGRFTLFENRKLRIYILLSSVIGTSTLTYAWFVQPVLLSVGIKHEIWFGILWTALNMSAGLTTMWAHLFEDHVGKKMTILLIVLFIVLGYICLYFFNGYFAIFILFVFYLARGIATPVLKNHINRITTSEIRATVLSLRSFIIRMCFAVVGPLAGWLMDKISLQYAMLIIGMVILSTGGTIALRIWKMND